MAYRRIVVGTDGSSTARIAERAAARLAALAGAELLVVTAYEPETTPASRAEEVVAAAADRAREAGLEARAEARAGDPSDAIMEFADMNAADLIVVGNVGMGQARRFRLGGVPDRISHYSPCDLLIVQTAAEGAADREPASYGRILIATDGSATADEASRRGSALASLVGARVDLVFVGDPLVGQVVMSETTDRLGLPDPVAFVRQGDPSREICAVAEREGHDLVVVGNRGMAGARRYVLDSVPNRVSHRARCDVLIAKTVGRSIEELGPGEGGVVLAAGRRVAAYRGEDGSLHALSSRCTHMGCTVGWNDAERTWDCPCHGSKYDRDGHVVRGPAEKDLSPVALDEA